MVFILQSSHILRAGSLMTTVNTFPRRT